VRVWLNSAFKETFPGT